MKILHTIARELFGLFVDDDSLALAILALLAVTAWLVRRGLFVDVSEAAVLLVAGSIMVLLENVVRSAGKSSPHDGD
jgi:hypothetical protein